MSTLDKVRVVIVGDSETGKTSLAELLAYGKPCERTMSTIGCTTHVKLHEFKAGLPQEKLFFIELWDIGGSRGHEQARSIFYNPVDGLILVHDLTNRKSQVNLTFWLKEVHKNKDGCKLTQVVTDFDRAVVNDTPPTLVVGTKVDLLRGQDPVPSYVAEDINADELTIDCTNARSLAAGSSNSVKMSRFFDSIIERKMNHSSLSSQSVQPRETHFPTHERKRNYGPSNTFMKSGHVD